MKTLTLLILCAVMVGCAGTPSSTEEAPADEGALHGGSPAANGKLTATQRKTVLNLIDDVCGDTWCEGDHNYAFKKMVCNFPEKTCTMTLNIIVPGPDDNSPAKTFVRSCKMTDIKSYDDMVEKLRFGDNLKEDFYGKVDQCVAKVEATVPH